MSDGRKIFKFLKWIESSQKSRWAMERMSRSFWDHGPGFMTIIHGLDTVAYGTSFFYYILDNVLWCTKVGMLRSKIIPENQKKYWQGWRLNGKVVQSMGGITGIKRNRNYCSFYRSIIALSSEFVYLLGMYLIEREEKKKKKGKLRKWVSKRKKKTTALQRVDYTAHFMAIIRILCNLRILLNRLKMWRCTDRFEGIYAMIAASMGIWKYATNRKPIKALDKNDLTIVCLF